MSVLIKMGRQRVGQIPYLSVTLGIVSVQSIECIDGINKSLLRCPIQHNNIDIYHGMDVASQPAS